MENPNPILKEKYHLPREVQLARAIQEWDQNIQDQIDQFQVFEQIRNLKDPQYPFTLEQLQIVTLEDIKVNNAEKSIMIQFTPTIQHCSLAQIIGLMIKVKLMQSFPRQYYTQVSVKQGGHVSGDDITKQINDKQRVLASLQNQSIKNVLIRGISNSV